MDTYDQLRGVRDGLLERREDYDSARAWFRWPHFEHFNWAFDWFDRLPERDRTALHVVDDAGGEHRRSFAELTSRSNQVANHLRGLGVRRGDRMILMLGNVPELWETVLGAMKLGVVVIPASTLLRPDDLVDRIKRGAARAVVAAADLAPRFEGLPGAEVRVAVGDPPVGWHAFADSASASAELEPDGPTAGDDPLFLYFTSGTTSLPKLVEHTHCSYPVGHLSTVYWLGLRPGDVHLNVSSPGWAKHAWSNVFAPWLAEATAFVHNAVRFDAPRLLDVVSTHGVTTFCAPPTVWRMLVQEDMAAFPVRLREVVSAGEPLNPEVIEAVRTLWGLTVRDGFGQTETTAVVGNPPGQQVKPGSMGRPLPGYEVVLLDAEDVPAEEGEIGITLDERPVGLMTAYRDDEHRTELAMRDGWYHTGDVAARDEDGYLTYVGRMDDLFKSSDYRISPFELESVLVEHEAVAEAAVVPSPDPIRLSVPKAFVVPVAGVRPDAALAESILAYARERLGPYRRVRRIEFAELPKTISGKIRRVHLRQSEWQRHGDADRNEAEWWEEDLPGLGRTR